MIGLSATRGPARGHADEIAARMIDAQAPGVAGVLRGLSEVPGSGEGWPGRLLGEYAQLHLLARAHQRLGDLPPELAATVRSRIGYPTARPDVLARPAVTDRWTVLGVRDLLDGHVPGRRIWLRGHDSGRWEMLLTFAAPGGAGRRGRLAGPGHGPAAAGDRATREPALLPGQPALRAAVGERHTEPTRSRGPAPRRRRRRPAGRLRGRPRTRSLADRMARPCSPARRSRPAAGAGSTVGPGKPLAADRPGRRRGAAGGPRLALDAARGVRRASGHGGGRMAPGRPAAAHGMARRPRGGAVKTASDRPESP